MANIIGEPFRDYVCKQIKVRQKAHGTGTGGTLRTPEELTYLNSKTAWAKLASGIYIEGFRVGAGGKDEEINDGYAGVELAKNNVLFGGVSRLESGKLKQRGTYNDVNNIWDYFKGTYNVNANLDNNSVTGEFGLVPMPGITSVDVKCLNRGSIKKATVDIKCYSPEQFQILNLLYLRIGYTMLLEWGWAPYLDNNGQLVHDYTTIIENEFFNSANNHMSHLNFLKKINGYRAAKNGNYDALLCKVTNFTWTFSNDGSYDIQLSLISLGDVVESLKSNITPSYPMYQYINITYKLYNENGLITGRYPANPVNNNIAAYLFLNEISLSDIANPNGIDDETMADYDLCDIVNTLNGNRIDLAGWFVPPPPGGLYSVEPHLVISPLFSTKAEALNWIANSPYTAYTEISDFRSTNFDPFAGSSTQGEEYEFGSKLNYPPGSPNQAYFIEESGVFFNSYTVYVREYADPVNINITRDKKDVIYLNYNDQENDIDEINPDGYYMRLGHLLEYINNNVVPKIEQPGNLQNIIAIDYGQWSNYMYIFPYQISLDPRVCVFNPGEVIGPPTAEKKMFWTLPDWKKPEKGYGYIMNLYVSHNQIRKSIEDNLDDDNNLALFDFIESLCTELNKALGGVNNLEPVIDEEESILKIIDSSYNPNKKGDCYTLELYGYKGDTSNFVHDFEIKTEITNEFATMATIGSTAGGYVKGTENTMFSKWNKGLKDRYKEKLVPGDPLSRESGSAVEEPNKMYIDKIWNGGFSVWGCTEYDVENDVVRWDSLGLNSEIIDQNISIATEFYKYCHHEIQKNYNKEYSSPTNGFIPISLGITMEGLSGIKIYNQINVDTRFLPSDYLDSLKFIIKGVNHSIKEGNWDTNIETIVISQNETNNAIPQISGSILPGITPSPFPFVPSSSNSSFINTGSFGGFGGGSFGGGGATGTF